MQSMPVTLSANFVGIHVVLTKKLWLYLKTSKSKRIGGGNMCMIVATNSNGPVADYRRADYKRSLVVLMVLSDKALGIMIELCTKKCMAIFTAIMLMVTIVVLVIENEFSVSHSMHALVLTKVPDDHSKLCWMHEKFEIKKECTYCTDFEKKSVAPYCQDTGFKMLVKCKDSGSKWKSCTSPKDPYIETRNFWLFESSMFTLALTSFIIVHARRKNLDKLLMDKINRQIASGV